MSTVIDEKIVKLGFDSNKFELGVAKALDNIDLLKQSLNFAAQITGIKNLSSAVNKMSFNGLSDSANGIIRTFNAMDVAIGTVLGNIATKALSTGKQITEALTIQPIHTGFSEYETQIGAVQTILANTKSKGSTIDDVNKALDDLNTYADKTIYNFTEMTRNIGTFTAAGVDLEKSVTAIKGIANLGAISGSTSLQVSTAMYQLSQALAAGRVSLMDWNSVVNAGMGGEIFQEALKRTARVMGENVDGMIEKYGNFRESLTQGNWLTADVLTETLTQLSGAYSKVDLMARGYTEEQAKEIMDLADTSVDAATKVKTFSALVDTTKEQVQSGWTSTWMIILGDYEEAKALWTGISNKIGEYVQAYSDARNLLLIGWDEGGGRTMMIESFANAFKGLEQVLKTVGKAFRNVFPKITSDQLLDVTKKVHEFTKGMKLSEEQMDNLRKTFEGIFTVVKAFLTVGAGIVGIFIAIGKGILNLLGGYENIYNALTGFSGYIGGMVSKLNSATGPIEAVSACFEYLKTNIDGVTAAASENIITPGLSYLKSILESTYNFAKSLGDAIVNIGKKISTSMIGAFRSGDINNLMGMINSGVFLSMLLKIKDTLESVKSDGGGSIVKSIKDVIGGAKDALSSFQETLNAKAISEIAKAIAILAAALFVISTIDYGKMVASLMVIGTFMDELTRSLIVFSSISEFQPRLMIVVTMLNGLATAVLILALAMRAIGGLNLTETATSLASILALITALTISAKILAKDKKMVMSGSLTILSMATGILIMASALKSLKDLKMAEMQDGLMAIAVLLATLTTAMYILSETKAKSKFSIGITILEIATSLYILSNALDMLSSIDHDALGNSIVALAIALGALVAAAKLLPDDFAVIGLGMIAAGSGLIILAKALQGFGNMTPDQVGTSLIVLAGSLYILSGALDKMKDTTGGAIALGAAAIALGMLAPVLAVVGNMKMTTIAKGLTAMALALIIIGGAGAALKPIIPTIMHLSGAVALFGAGCLAAGVGVGLLAAGVTALGVAFASGSAAIVTGITALVLGLIGLIPALAQKFGEAVVIFFKVIGDSAMAIGTAISQVIIAALLVVADNMPQLINGFLKIFTNLLQGLATYGPQIAAALSDFVLACIRGLKTYVPIFVKELLDTLMIVFKSVVDELKSIDTSVFIEALIGVGVLSAFLMSLSLLPDLIFPAMKGVLALGALIAEIAAIIALFGAIGQIPGAKWLMDEGGNFLQLIGAGIGKFIGGIVGGVKEGVSDTLPAIGTNLSIFMTNFKPFLDTLSTFDPSVIESAKALSSTILEITKGEVLDAITSFISGEDSLELFGEKIVSFGSSLKGFSDAIVGIDSENMTAAVTATKGLVSVAKQLPKEGGLGSIFGGVKDFGTFGTGISSFGASLKDFSDSVVGVDSEAVTNAVKGAKQLVKFLNGIKEFSANGAIQLSTAIDALSTATINDFTTKFKEQKDNFKQTGGNLALAIVNGIRSKKENIVGAAKYVYNTFKRGINSDENKTNLQAVGKSYMSYFKKGLSEGKKISTTYLKTMITEMVTAIKEKRNNFKSAGKYLVEGFAAGIKDNDYLAVRKARAMAKKAADAINKELKINSPSKVTEESGIWFVAGFAKAIKERSKDAVNAAIVMAVNSSKALNNAIDKYWKSIMDFEKNYQDTNIFNEVTKQTDENKKRTPKNLSNNLKDQVNQLKEFSKIITSLKNRLKGTSLYNTIANMGVESLDNLRLLNKMTDKELKEYVSLFDEKNKMLFDNEAEYKEFQENTLNATIDVLDKYTQELDRNTESYMNHNRIFDEVNTKIGMNGQYLLRNLNDQVSQLEQYKNVMDSLKKRLGDSNLYKTLSEMGVESVYELEAINNMTEEELNEYIKLYNSKYELSKELAFSNMDEIKKETEEQLGDLYGGVNVDLDGFLSVFDGTFESISKYVEASIISGGKIVEGFEEGINDRAEDVKKTGEKLAQDVIDKADILIDREAKKIGASLTDGFAEGINNQSDVALKAAEGLVNAAVEKIKDELGIHSPSTVGIYLGEMLDKGFSGGIVNNVNFVESAMNKLSSKAINGLKAMIETISLIISDDLDIQPVIRPILDTTELENGFSTIDDKTNRKITMQIYNSEQENEPIKDNSNGIKNVNNYYTQNNYSPKSLSRVEIYRQTKNQLSRLKEELV